MRVAPSCSARFHLALLLYPLTAFQVKSLSRFNMPAVCLIVLLERLQVLRLVVASADFAAPSRIVALLKATFASAASLGAMHTLVFFSSRRRHTRWNCDWSSDVCSSD